MADQLKQLKKQRSILKAQLTRLNNFLLEFNGVDLNPIHVRKANLDRIFNSFQNVQLEIELAEDTDVDDSIETIEFEERYYECAEKIRRLLSSSSRSSCSLSDTNIASSSFQDRKDTSLMLPKIQLPTFDGDLTQWRSFSDTFRSLVHENENIINVQKFHYLKASLQGEAATVINTLNASAENYLVAWSMLEKRCNQPRKIIQSHLRAFLELSPIIKESPSAIRTLILSAEMHVNALKSLKVPVEHWNEILVYILSTKLDKNTRRSWDRSLEDSSLPTFEELLQFLNKFSREDDLSNEPVQSRSKCNEIREKIGTKHKHAYVGTQSGKSCSVCKGDHNIYQCNKFKGLSVIERSEAVKRANLCYNCLRTGHVVNRCLSRGCQICNRRHNTLLHQQSSSDKLNQVVEGSKNGSSTEVAPVTLNTSTSSEVLLSTARIYIFDQHSNRRECRVLLDSASQSNFITERLANMLQLQKRVINMPVLGLNQQNFYKPSEIDALIGA
ncbi:uncharacterized protein LOC112904173 [Agrilus planipennis]|uniref:Uncharacterized protein LOC112904173 n=1 Tax=Agrilus planipennis TaxID=224129 RepID=A0A7F5R267_AGRPL|nr:uncharacterized protein LOC112904173 [Agrilus planipennis]